MARSALARSSGRDRPRCRREPDRSSRSATGRSAGSTGEPARLQRLPVSVADTGVIECDVEITELMGAETYLYLLCEGHSLTARVSPRTLARPSEVFSIAIDPEKIHIFDRETERTIIN